MRLARVVCWRRVTKSNQKTRAIEDVRAQSIDWPLESVNGSSRSTEPSGLQNFDRRRQALGVGVRSALNLPHDIHALDDATECGEPLAVGIAGAAEVERRLIVDADEPAGCGAVGLSARHRDRTVRMAESGHAGPLDRNRWKAVPGPLGAHARLDHFDLYRAVGLIVHFDGAMERA